MTTFMLSMAPFTYLPSTERTDHGIVAAGASRDIMAGVASIVLALVIVQFNGEFPDAILNSHSGGPNESIITDSLIESGNDFPDLTIVIDVYIPTRPFQ